ncbi:MAG: flavodoxin-dependent (E)-4-hydroxy-3-methylbut-2-enyl-diphosphate synthase [Spirochaetales bacterium]|nr:flavodoxin-dependent (E)-4-hydroxy-3-methylbut-2-enyl-diphosphate synthase [Spirochaetales bacterium]
MKERRKSRPVKVGSVIVGGGFPVSVQTMLKDPLLKDLTSIKNRLDHLYKMGCEIGRFSVLDAEAAERLNKLSQISPIPLVADIQYDYKLALKCMEADIAKIRINPGNIGQEWKVKEVLNMAAGKGLPIRIGINGGSLPTSLRKEKDKAVAMVKAAEMELEILAKQNFHNVIFSLKSSNVDETIRANIEFGKLCDFPLHLGITEAGALIPGVVKSSIGFHKMFSEGLGDTIRVSLADTPENEVITGKEILRVAGLTKRGINLVSCPRCGRTTFDRNFEFLKKISDYCETVDKDATVAVMGCAVNGPGEAKTADLGISGVGNEIIIYKDGKILKRSSLDIAFDQFKSEIDAL